MELVFSRECGRSRGVLREGFGLLGSRLQGVIHRLFRIVLSNAKELDEFEEEEVRYEELETRTLTIVCGVGVGA